MNICGSCGKIIPLFQVAHIFEDDVKLCDKCFKKYEQDNDKI
jgi:hypothetical protein